MEKLETFFAKRVLKEHYTEESALFLASLMEVSRQGHLCWTSPNAPSFPAAIVDEGAAAPVVKQGGRYYLRRNWVLETEIVKRVQELRAQAAPPCHDREKFLQELEGAPLSPRQKEVVRGAFDRSFALICGGPGTGKTYTAAVLVRLLLSCHTKKKYKVIVAAPTGKAASHLQATLSVPVEAMTLHRLLRLRPGESPLFSDRKVDADLVIVDEASMIDVPLLAQLFTSIGKETRLVLMGDPDQLPPVEAGSLFAEMAELFGLSLAGSMRTDKAHLRMLAEEINRGEASFEGVRLPWAFDGSLAEKIYQVVNPRFYEEEPKPEECLRQIRILGALRQGPYGTEALNRQIVEEMGRRLKPGQWWAVPIMVTSNGADFYNGSSGVLIGKGVIDLRRGTAYFPEKIAGGDLPPFEVAFCLSIHKSQGSEFERVLALFPPGSENFGRESLYTAVTRAKEEVQIVADEETLRAMLSQRSRRMSGFTERLLGAASR